MKHMKFLSMLIMALVLISCGGKDDKKREGAEANESGAGNGGGAIKREGEVLTFGQYGVTVRRKSNDQIQGLKELEAGLNILTLPENVKGQILMAITPLGKRKYYDIDASELGPEKKKLILKKYQQAIRENIPLDHLSILAVTVGNESFMLPDFYQLKDNISRAAILFHEAMWLINPKLDYRVVIGAEIAFEKFLRDNLNKNKTGYDTELLQALKLVFNDPYIGISTAAKYEFGLNKIQEYILSDGQKITIENAKFTLRFIIGELMLQSFGNTNLVDKGLLYENLYHLHKLNPESVILKELLIESPGMDAKLVLDVYNNGYQKESFSGSICSNFSPDRLINGDLIRGVFLGYKICDKRKNEFYWVGDLGEEIFDLKVPHFLDEDAQPDGFQGQGGTIGLEYNTHFGQRGVGVYHTNKRLTLFVTGVQVEMPSIKLSIMEKCERVQIRWPHDNSRIPVEDYEDTEVPTYYNRCYQVFKQ